MSADAEEIIAGSKYLGRSGILESTRARDVRILRRIAMERDFCATRAARLAGGPQNYDAANRLLRALHGEGLLVRITPEKSRPIYYKWRES